MTACYKQCLELDTANVSDPLHCADACLRNSKCSFYYYKDYGIVEGLCWLFEDAPQNMNSNCFTNASNSFEHWQGLVNRGLML